jgi:hypothetical protein
MFGQAWGIAALLEVRTSSLRWDKDGSVFPGSKDVKAMDDIAKGA